MTNLTTDNTPNGGVPLCVDLDGTLIRSDLLLESFFALLKQNFFSVFLIPLWLIKGKAHLKQKIADRVDVDVSLLPYNVSLLDYLREQKALGSMLVLATATNVRYAQQINGHLGLFDQVLASDANINLSGHRKCRRLLETFGDKGFDYAANAGIDLEIWSHARKAVLVEPDPGVREKAEKLIPIDRVFEAPRTAPGTYLKAMRLHQWLKNLLIFVPLIMAHQFDDTGLLLQGVLAFLAFGLCASSVYLLNDLLDLPADRQHPGKSNRPLAAGTLPIRRGALLVPVLMFAALLIALPLPPAFLGALLLYYVITLAYSLFLKEAALVDVLVLAGLYTIRLVAGAAAVTVVLSFWLLAFSMFLFLSLALVKRYAELLETCNKDLQPVQGRGYQTTDLDSLSQLGITSGYMSVLVLAFYINSDQVTRLYTYPEAIWLLCPLLLYWISRIWLLARRNKMHEDPVIFAIEDRRSHWLVIIGLLILWLAT